MYIVIVLILVLPQSPTDWHMHHAKASHEILVEQAKYEKSQTLTITTSRNNDLLLIKTIDFPVVAPQQAGRKIPTRNDDPPPKTVAAKKRFERLRKSLRPP